MARQFRVREDLAELLQNQILVFTISVWLIRTGLPLLLRLRSLLRLPAPESFNVLARLAGGREGLCCR